MNRFVRQLDPKVSSVTLDFTNEGDLKSIAKFSVLRLVSGQQITVNSGPYEIGIMILQGTCDLSVDGKKVGLVGVRTSVFDGLPEGVYIPKDTTVVVDSAGVEIALCYGVCKEKKQFSLIRQSSVKQMNVGKGNWQRDVRMVIAQDGPSENLLLGETFNPAGNWSGTPPHKHEGVGNESLHEELYYFRIAQSQGFGIEKFYSVEHNVDLLIPLKNETVTLMPWGYHQIVAGPGYDLYYLFFLSGSGTKLCGVPDPEHAWLLK